MSASHSITLWKLLALLAALAGAACTLLADQIWLNSWSSSGKRFPLGDWYEVELQPGPVLVYYESPISVPDHGVDLIINDPSDRAVSAYPAEDQDGYRVWLTGTSGRALWDLDILEAGPYQFTSTNDRIAADDVERADDCIVFAKQPNSLAEATTIRRTIQITGAVITIVLVIAFYVMHGLSQRKQEARPTSRFPNHTGTALRR